MANFFKIVGLTIFSVIATEIITLVFFYIRFIADSNYFYVGWVIAIPVLTAILTGFLTFLFAKLLKYQKAERIGLIYGILWVIFLYISQFIKK